VRLEGDTSFTPIFFSKLGSKHTMKDMEHKIRDPIFNPQRNFSKKLQGLHFLEV
jgi:hypothetical protein